MEYSEINTDLIRKAVNDAFMNQVVTGQRQVKIITNIYGYEKFQEAMENEIGFGRTYLGTKKVPRFLRKMKTPIFKSITGRYYRRCKLKEQP